MQLSPHVLSRGTAASYTSIRYLLGYMPQAKPPGAVVTFDKLSLTLDGAGLLLPSVVSKAATPHAAAAPGDSGCRPVLGSCGAPQGPHEPFENLLQPFSWL